MANAARAHPDAASSLRNLGGVFEAANWRSMNDIVRTSPGKPSPIGSERVVFNVSGNDYRLICAVDFKRGTMWVKWFGSHSEYDKIDAETAENFEKYDHEGPDGHQADTER